MSQHPDKSSPEKQSLHTSEEKQQSCPSVRLAHLAILRLQNAGLIPKVLAALSHLAVELVDHFVEDSDSDLEFDADLGDESD